MSKTVEGRKNDIVGVGADGCHCRSRAFRVIGGGDEEEVRKKVALQEEIARADDAFTELTG